VCRTNLAVQERMLSAADISCRIWMMAGADFVDVYLVTAIRLQSEKDLRYGWSG
jgi:hypothetical protein